MSNDAVVFIVDTDASHRQAVETLVRARHVRAVALESVAEFLERFHDEPGCTVADLQMHGPDGAELLDALRLRGWSIPVILLAQRPSTAAIVRALRNGAVTVLDKPPNDDELGQAIDAALAIDDHRRRRRHELAGLRQRFASLSDKERDVLQMIVAGRPNKTIANSLGASLRTIENRRREVFSKLGVRSVAELVTLSLKLEGNEDL